MQTQNLMTNVPHCMPPLKCCHAGSRVTPYATLSVAQCGAFENNASPSRHCGVTAEFHIILMPQKVAHHFQTFFAGVVAVQSVGSRRRHA